MKTIQKLMFLVLFYQLMPSLLVAQATRPEKSANPDKPFIFSALPERFECATAALKQVFSAQLNDAISIPLPGNRFFKGVVKARVQRDANVLSVNVHSTNFPGAMLNLSLIIQPDKTEKIIGRVLNPQKGDALVIERVNDRYFISKDLQKFVMTDCPLPEMVQDQSDL
jgi:hypothetical protein